MNERYADQETREIYEREKWTSCSLRKLVSLYRKSVCLWKKDTMHYLDGKRRHRAYAAIQRDLNLVGVTLVEIMLKIREIRGLYVRELKRTLEAEANGCYYETVLPWFYDLHRFLYPYLDYHEAAELHDVGGRIDRLDHLDDEDLYGKSSSVCCIQCLTSNSNTFDSCMDFLSTTLDHGSFNSNSSPVVSLQEVASGPRTCPRSCTGFTCTRKRPNKSSCNIYRTSSVTSFCRIDRGENSNRIDEMDEMERFHDEEFLDNYTRCKVNSFYADRDQFESFSKSIGHCLQKMDKDQALKAQSEIQKILLEVAAESNSKKRGTVQFLEVSPSRSPISRREGSNQHFVYSPDLKGSCR